MSTTSIIQQTHLALPDRPEKVKDRAWDMFAAHVHEGKTFRALGEEHGVTTERVRQIVYGVHQRYRPKAAPYLTANAMIALRYTPPMRTYDEIAREAGCTRERVKVAIADRVAQALFLSEPIPPGSALERATNDPSLLRHTIQRYVLLHGEARYWEGYASFRDDDEPESMPDIAELCRAENAAKERMDAVIEHTTGEL